MDANLRRRGRRRLFYVAILVILLAGAGYGTVRYRAMAAEMEMVRNLEIEDMDLSSVHDGTYYGAYVYGGFTYEVNVTIRNYAIQSIQILSNRNTRYARMAAGVVDNVLARGNTNADVVSGATTTSKALLKAIEQAIFCNL